MKETFRAFRIHRADEPGRVVDLSLEDLGEGEVVIDAQWSSVNYKDALAGTGKGRILRRFPLVGGIDVAGTVRSSGDPRFQPGDTVLVTGYGLSQDQDGGYAERVRVPADWVVPIPAGLDPRTAMALGTAGFTAALALVRMERNGQSPDLGDILVTGATGGVGSLAVDIFSGRGYRVVAVTGKDEAEYLRGLGASEVLGREALKTAGRPLERARWAGAVDNVGGETLADITRTLKPWGNVASIGMAGGVDLRTSVMPFIIRGASVLGITSAGCPMPLRQEVWERLAGDLAPRHLERSVTQEVTLDGLTETFEAMLGGCTRGRTLVRLGEGS